MVSKDNKLVLEEGDGKHKTLAELSESTALRGKKKKFSSFLSGEKEY